MFFLQPNTCSRHSQHPFHIGIPIHLSSVLFTVYISRKCHVTLTGSYISVIQRQLLGMNMKLMLLNCASFHSDTILCQQRLLI